MGEVYRSMYIVEDNMELMRKAAKGAMQTIKFKDGKLKMDSFTASAIMGVHAKVNPKNKSSMESMINSGTKAQIMKLQSLAMKSIKSETDPDVVKEGTWQMPQGNQAMKGLKRLLSKPIPVGKMASNAKNKIDKYIGDDELFDDLEDAADKNPKGDAVPLIKKAMKRLNIKEELSLDEGKMSQMHQMIKDKKTPAQIAKAMGLDIKTVKALMASYEQMVPESFEIGTEKYLKHTVETTPGQKEWKETVSKKAASMRETLAKMWKVDEGKNVFAKDEKKDLTSEVKGGKTMTGKKVAEIDTKPTIKEKKK